MTTTSDASSSLVKHLQTTSQIRIPQTHEEPRIEVTEYWACRVRIPDEPFEGRVTVLREQVSGYDGSEGDFVTIAVTGVEDCGVQRIWSDHPAKAAPSGPCNAQFDTLPDVFIDVAEEHTGLDFSHVRDSNAKQVST